MQFKTLKGLILATSAIAAVSILNTTDVKAATNATMGVSIEAIDAVDVDLVNNMNFGKWLLTHDGSENIVLNLDPNTNGVTVNPALTTSAAQQIASTSRSGRLSVDIPSGINNYTLQMIVDPPTAPTDAGYTLTSINYTTATENTPTTITADGIDTAPVTVVTGGTPEIVYFGGVLTVTAQPAVGEDTGATFNVEFSY